MKTIALLKRRVDLMLLNVCPFSFFRLQGEPVNLREQQDAVEFFMSLFESIDEGLKALNCEQLMSATLGGCFSDQKICQDCPHRYSKDEPFSVLSVDIRNHSSLTDSLEQYVRGEILEGADAYHCDKCDEKVCACQIGVYVISLK